MTIDVGLTAGIKSLWQQEALFDYTIQVGDYEIPVHKAIMASVSEYFKVMLNGSLLETRTNRVELKGQNVEAVSKLIELIYTGNEKIVDESAMDIFGAAVYFQMSFVTQACVDNLQDNLNEKNCLDVLSLFVKYSFNEEVDKVKKFLKSNCKTAVEYCKHEETSFEAVQIIAECWGKSEWDLFLFLKYWVNIDNDRRNIHVNDLMSLVRFSLIDQGQLAAIMDMDIFTRSEDPWCALVHKAVTYQKESINHKILDTSDQAKTRGPTVPMVFSAGKTKAKSLYVLENNDDWSELKVLQAPTISGVVCSIEVNNFFIVCAEDGKWHVFNPRTMKWSQMASMSTPKTGFALAHHGEYLYALGGKMVSQEGSRISRSVEQYSFQTNIWEKINKMPIGLTGHGASAYEDSIYVLGGQTKIMVNMNQFPLQVNATELRCLDLRSGTWERKAPMPHSQCGHKLHVMTLNKEKVIITFKHDNYDHHINYYQPATDQWTEYSPNFSPQVPYDVKWENGESMMLVKENRAFFINIQQGDEDADASSGWDEEAGCYICPEPDVRKVACVLWKFSQARKSLSEVDYPMCPSRSGKMFGAILSM